MLDRYYNLYYFRVIIQTNKQPNQLSIMNKSLSKQTVIKACELSAEWNNTAFICEGSNGKNYAVVWNKFQYLDPKPHIIATVNDKGLIIKDKSYSFDRSSVTNYAL